MDAPLCEELIVEQIEMFYLNTIEQLFLVIEQLDQLEVCLPNSRLLTRIAIFAVFQNCQALCPFLCVQKFKKMDTD